MRRPALLLAVLVLLVAVGLAPANAHHKPGHHHGPPMTPTTLPPPTTTTLPATTTTAEVPVPTTTTTIGTCQAPLTISTGGTWSGGCYESLNAATPAVTISTTQPVTLDRVLIRHAGRGVVTNTNSTSFTVTNSTFQRLNPGTPQGNGGRAMFIQQAASVVIEHNRFLDGNGIYWLGDVVNPTLGRVRYNHAVNIGRWKNGSSTLVQFFQTDKVNLPGLEVAWNHVFNTFGQSAVEDNINLFQTTGSSGSPIDVHHNLIDGAFPLTAGGGYSGGGIICGDQGGTWTNLHDNYVTATVNYGVAISGGSNSHAYSNRVTGRSRAHDGTLMTAGNVGIYVWNHAADPTWATNDAHDNLSGWLTGALARNNYYLPDCDPPGACTNNTAQSDPIDAAAEQATRDAWETARAAAGVTVGPLP